jgi:hypothetical protein
MPSSGKLRRVALVKAGVIEKRIALYSPDHSSSSDIYFCFRDWAESRDLCAWND